MKNKFLIFGILILISAFSLTQISNAQSAATQRIGGILDRLTGFALGLLIALATLFIIYAAYVYLTAAGDPEKVKTANRVILYAAIAIAVGLLSKTLVFIVRQLLEK